MLFADVGLPGLPLFPPEASEHAGRVDALFLFILLVVGGTALLVGVLLAAFSTIYRRRAGDRSPPRITGNPLLEWGWTLAPIPVFGAMFVWGFVTYRDNLRPPADCAEVFVVGKQWIWKIQHGGGQREINQLHLPVGRPVKLTLISEDVIHDFGIPAFRQKVDVLPGRYVSTWYSPTAIGQYHLFCDQYCGTNHAKMIGSVTVMRPDEFEIWQSEQATGSPALEGRKLFLKLQCLSCHSSNSEARAPVLEGLYGTTVPLKGGKQVVADSGYIRESILWPGKKVVAGWEPIMPTYQGQVTEDELIQLIAYIRSLKPGATPVRNEVWPAPTGTPNAGATGEKSK